MKLNKPTRLLLVFCVKPKINIDETKNVLTCLFVCLLFVTTDDKEVKKWPSDWSWWGRHKFYTLLGGKVTKLLRDIYLIWLTDSTCPGFMSHSSFFHSFRGLIPNSPAPGEMPRWLPGVKTWRPWLWFNIVEEISCLTIIILIIMAGFCSWDIKSHHTV